MYFERHLVTITGTSSGGGASAYTPPLNGRLYSIRCSSGATLGTTTLVTAVNEATNETCYSCALGTAGTTVRPRSVIVRSTGTIVYHSTAAAQPEVECFEFANERLKLSVGATTAGSLTGDFLIGVG